MKNYLNVKFGSIYIGDSDIFMDNACIIFDKSDGCVLKYGDRDTSGIKKRYEEMCAKLVNSGCNDMVEDLVLIEFDRYESALSIEDICTIVNYGINCHSEKFLELFSMSEENLKNQIKLLQDIGY